MIEPGFTIKSIRNNILPICVYYLMFIVGVLSLIELLVQTFQDSLPKAILFTTILAGMFIAFTIHLISFVSQRYVFYAEQFVVYRLFNKKLILRYDDVLEVRKEQSLLRAITFLLTYSVRIRLKDGSIHCFGPVRDVNKFVGLLERK